MKRYLYCYNTIVSFSEPVGNHEFLIRCQPVLGEYMNVEEEHLVLPPDYWKHHGTDTFKNRIVYGGNREPHQSLAYVSTGIVSMQTYRIHSDSLPISIWLQPTHLTNLHTFTSLSFNLPRAEMSCMERAESIMHHINSILAYVPHSTDIETTAQEVIDSGQGVCQDFAHLMIAVCRHFGIPARYVCGFVEGTGETHAWVEVFDAQQGYWFGFDPTYDHRIDLGYVKLAHGRDAADCPVSRGQYNGFSNQETKINVILKAI